MASFRQPFVAVTVLCFLPSLSAAQPAYRLILGAPPLDFRETNETGRLYPRGYSPGYGPYNYSKHLPSLIITNAPPPALYPLPPPADAGLPPTAAVLRVLVPREAAVWIAGRPTTQQGMERLYLTPRLDGAGPFVYEVRARWSANGRPMHQARSVTFHRGDRVTVDFLGAAKSESEQLLPMPQKLEGP